MRRRGARHLGTDRGAIGLRTHVLHRAVIRLQAAKAQACRRVGAPRQRQRQHHLRVGHPAASLAYVHLDQHRHPRPRALHGLRQCLQVVGMVHAYADVGLARQLAQQGQLHGADHLVADVDIAHASRDERQRLAHLLAADAARAQRKLAQGHLRALVRLGVGPQRHAKALGPILHDAQIALERRKIQRQTGRIDIAQGLPGAGGRRQYWSHGSIHSEFPCSYSFRRLRRARQVITWAGLAITRGRVYPQVNDTPPDIG
ncbi:Uncharacterised protein [Bordetella pertussis]|nr:Uncharacterised protein [Bordetella pertussis]